MDKINYKQVRELWSKSTKSEINYRLAHIDSKKQEIVDLYKKQRAPVLEEAELLFNIFTFLNWLAHIDLANHKYIREEAMIIWLQEKTSWPKFVVEAFWFCLRNPNMHMGRTSIFSDYDRISNIEQQNQSIFLLFISKFLPFLYKKIQKKFLFNNKYKLFAGFMNNLNFDPMVSQPKNFKPNEAEDGYITTTDSFDSKKLVVTFYYHGVGRKLQIMSEKVLEKISKSDKTFLKKLIKLNKKILPIYYTNE